MLPGAAEKKTFLLEEDGSITAGDSDEALDWFRRAYDQQQSEKIRELATIAISRLQAERRVTDPVLVREDKRREESKPPANLEVKARVGIGSDDNIFRAPNQPYIDLADPTLPLVVPEIFSATFVPVDFQARYVINSLKWENFFGAYRLAGRFYDGYRPGHHCPGGPAANGD